MITAVVASIAITQREARLEKERRKAEEEAAAKKSVIVVGGGVCGLAAATIFRHHGFKPVTVLEATAAPSDSPGIVTLAPNALRVLEKVDDLKADLFETTSDTTSIRYRNYETGKVRLTESLAPTTVFDPPTLSLAWSELHELLLGYAENLGAEIHFSCPVTEYHDTPGDLDGPLPHGRPYVLTAGGEKVYADGIVCADGLNSEARKHVASSLGLEPVLPKSTGFSCFRGSVPCRSLKGDVDTEALVRRKYADVWVGPNAYLAAYTVCGEQEWMYHLTRSDSHLAAKEDGYDSRGSIKDVKKCVDGWQPLLQKALAKSIEVFDQKLLSAPTIPPWVSKNSKKLVLLGDAAHPFPPASSQSLSMTIEDIAVLAVCMKKAASIPLALEVYTRLRKPRVEKALANAEEAMDSWRIKIDEGKGWRAKDVMFDERSLWDFDAEKDADSKFDGIIDQLMAELVAKRQEMMKAAALAEAKAASQAKEPPSG